ncbi:PROTEIN NRT1/ PTR FAMILY 5.2-RELATED [Salix purpurea]|uniref:PROTEIN NRT1/ PTR FAMILY 5.2-RELATED n=1 Tax=Salix purpurea TaxID=77065 RepID=A0A9Q0TX26_SALPP|nr:PROTEIN NRT1/ PTR FAMILY 5.2-RELATED [Salix purpurea]
MAYYGISSNLVVYLTKKLRQGTVESSNNVTNWVGTIWLTPILGAYVADAHLGRYWTFVTASIIYLTGMSLLTLSVSLPALRPPICTNAAVETCKEASTLQLAVFLGALYTLAVGTGGTKPNISTIGAEQFDDFHPEEKAYKLSFFNWWMFSIFFGTLFANTPARHFIGTGSLQEAHLQGWLRSSWQPCANGRFQSHNDPKELHELDSEEYAEAGKFRIDSTPTLRFLNKAAVKTGPADPWMLCSVTQVEETKQMLRMIPILIATFVPSTMIAQINTLFVKQGTTLDRQIGSFEVPPASLAGFVTLSMLVCVVLYDRFFVRIARRWTKNPRGITLLQRMGIGLVFHIIIMIIASLIERYRLSVARQHGLVEKGGQVPLTIFILLPQFVLMGTADAFLEVAKLEFFFDQAPESMKSLGTSYATTSFGVGNFISSFLLSTVSHITKKHGHRGWILNNLNASHLDYYYAFLAILNFLNFIFFLVVIRFYVYKAEVSDSMEVLAEELKGMRLREPNQVSTHEWNVKKKSLHRNQS